MFEIVKKKPQVQKKKTHFVVIVLSCRTFIVSKIESRTACKYDKLQKGI